MVQMSRNVYSTGEMGAPRGFLERISVKSEVACKFGQVPASGASNFVNVFWGAIGMLLTVGVSQFSHD